MSTERKKKENKFRRLYCLQKLELTGYEGKNTDIICVTFTTGLK
jgi:hypothetical protein